MNRLIKGATLAAMLLGASVAGAQPFNGASKIVRGDYAAAEHELVTARAANPDDVELMLNLATVYAITGRPTLARALYRQAATRPDEALILVSGAALSSRGLATRGLARLPAAVTAN